MAPVGQSRGNVIRLLALRAGRGDLELSTLKSADEVYGADELRFRQVAVTEVNCRSD